MARQSTTPVAFNQSTRKDTSVLMTSARAGVVVPVAYVPLLPGDSAAGRVGIDIQLKEMPKPLLNGVHANIQAWFVPKSAFPQFGGRDDVVHALAKLPIKTLGAPDRPAPNYFTSASPANVEGFDHIGIYKALGIHATSGAWQNVDILDAYSLIYNFRLAAHSSKLQRRKYWLEDQTESTNLARAFWPSSRLSHVVPDYERALIMGALDLDVIAGRLPVSGIGVHFAGGAEWTGPHSALETGKGAVPQNYGAGTMVGEGQTNRLLAIKRDFPEHAPAIFAEMAGQQVGVTLADIDKARTTQAFAKARTAYAGNDTTGFDNDDAIIAMLMQGIAVEEDKFKRPWLLDSARVPVGFAERFATDAANLDASVSIGRASAQLSLNVPRQEVGGLILVTVEVLPERVDERMSDEWLCCVDPDDLPNALRDVQRTEPVDLVLNRRVDARHASPHGLYGYEAMNEKWNRDFTRLGGDFYMETPGGGWTESRSNIWQTEIVNPTLSDTHYLAPAPFPHTVFADQMADAFEVVCRHAVSIVGLTQFGDVLAENNDDYAMVEDAG